MITRLIAWSGAAVLLAAAAWAEPLPAWSIADICRSDSAPGQCARFESEARNAVTGSWGVLLPATQSACLGAAQDPSDVSWRALADCIDQHVRRDRSQHAIATRDTPAEPAPAGAATPIPPSAPSQPSKSD